MSELSDKIKTTFGLAALQKEAAQNMTPDEWKQYQAINKKFDGKVAFEKRQFDLDYDRLVDEARLRLINKAGSKQKSFVNKVFGRDGFDTSAINRQAQLEVRNTHQATLDGLENLRFNALKQHTETSAYRKEQREKPQKDFQRATDRRRGPDRRAPSR